MVKDCDCLTYHGCNITYHLITFLMEGILRLSELYNIISRHRVFFLCLKTLVTLLEMVTSPHNNLESIK